MQDATPKWNLGRDRVSWEWVACSGGNTQTIRKIPLLAGSRVVGGNLGNGLRVPVGRSVPRRSWEKSTSSDQWGNFEKNNFEKNNFEKINFEKNNFEKINFEKNNFEKNKCWKATPRWKLGRGPLLDGNRVVAGEAGGLPGSFLPRNVRKWVAGKILVAARISLA